MTDSFRIESEQELESVVGGRVDAMAQKVAPTLDNVMQQFIEHAPLVFVSTVDEDGTVDVSPKGDPPGFVLFESASSLLIPERPGNKLTMGFRNILRNGKIGMLFLVPNQRESLRVKGTATLHSDPDVLEAMRVNGKPALLYTRVAVTECFFHCGKALIRSRLWSPEHWEELGGSLGARQFASLSGGGEEAYRETQERLENSYKNNLY